MSNDDNDIEEFLELTENTTTIDRDERPIDAFMKTIESSPQIGSKKEPGQPVQYSRYKSGFTSTTSTVPNLPSGCYEIRADNNCVHVIPMKDPEGLLLELPEMKSDDVIKTVETFWNSEKDYKEGNEFVHGGAIYKAGIMLYGPPGCHAKGTEILMFDGTIKKVENIEVGDLLMGPDSNPRKVLELKRGREEMVKIKPTKGQEFIINKSHILHLSPSGKEVLTQTPINMKFTDWLSQKQNFQNRYKLTRIGVNFSERDLPIDPYFLGIWLGDGNSNVTSITTADFEISEYLNTFSKKLNMQFKEVGNFIGKGLAKTYTITNGLGQKNPLFTALKELELINNKHIPYIYKTSDRQQRLELLAGIIDTDGHLHQKTIEFSNKSEALSNDVVFLARSLGFASYITQTRKQCVNNGVWGTYFRVSISGNVSEIPCKIARKISLKRKQIKNVLKTGFTYEILPVDDFYGFTLNEDHLYLTADFTIHHNSGKSCTLKIVSKKLIERKGIVFYANQHPVNILDFLTDFSKIEDNRKCIVVFEDIDSLIDQFGESFYLEMLDSAKSINNVLFIATTNYPDKLDPRIYNRPGRFSHIIKIGLPTVKAREAYLKAILKDHRDVDYIVKESEGFTIDHLSALVSAVYREKKDLKSELKRLRTLFKVPKIKDDTVGISFKGEE